MVCGALLIKEGYKVCIVEKHTTIGGGLHMFQWKGMRIETGMHVVSGFEETGVLRRLFSYLGVMEQMHLKLTDAHQFDVVRIGDDIYRLALGRENFVNALARYFPEEKDNLKAYIDRIYKISEDISLFNLEFPTANAYSQLDVMGMSADEFIASYTQNKKLQTVLAWNSSLYGGRKTSTPAYITALISKFYIEGAARFVGGSQQLADALSAAIIRGGGEIILGDGVKFIDVQDKKVQHIRTQSGRVLTADIYISSIHTSTMFTLMDTTKIQRSYYNRIDNIPNSYSVFITYVKFKPNSFPFFNYTYYYQPDYDTTWLYDEYTEDTWPRGAMFITPPDTENDEYADKMIINCIMRYDSVKQWENTTVRQRGNDYLAFKRKHEQKVLSFLEQVYPDFRKKYVEAVTSASPLTIRDYYGAKEGAIYGTIQDCNNLAASHIAPRTKIENLYLTGQNLNLHGILGVPLTAIATCGELVGLEYLLNKIRNQ